MHQFAPLGPFNTARSTAKFLQVLLAGLPVRAPLAVQQTAQSLLACHALVVPSTLLPGSDAQGALLPLLGHSNRQLRHTSGTIASVIVGLGGLDEWPELAAALPCCLQAEDPNVLDGAQDTLYKVWERTRCLACLRVKTAAGC